MKYDKQGRELPSNIPVSFPVQWRRPPTLQEQIRTLVKREMSQQAASEGYETFEEADDFEVDDDFDPTSPWENEYEPIDRNAGSEDSGNPGNPRGDAGQGNDAQGRGGSSRSAAAGGTGAAQAESSNGAASGGSQPASNPADPRGTPSQEVRPAGK